MYLTEPILHLVLNRQRTCHPPPYPTTVEQTPTKLAQIKTSLLQLKNSRNGRFPDLRECDSLSALKKQLVNGLLETYGKIIDIPQPRLHLLLYLKLLGGLMGYFSSTKNDLYLWSVLNLTHTNLCPIHALSFNSSCSLWNWTIVACLHLALDSECVNRNLA